MFSLIVWLGFCIAGFIAVNLLVLKDLFGRYYQMHSLYAGAYIMTVLNIFMSGMAGVIYMLFVKV